MEKSNKMMLGAALVVALVALAGAGYAIDYTAKTTNSNNSMDTTYLVLAQSGPEDAVYAGTTSILTNLYFNTEKTASSVTYTPVSGYGLVSGNYTTSAETKEYALVSDVLTLTLTPTNNKAESADMTVTATNFSPINGLTYTMVLGTKQTTGSGENEVTTITPTATGVRSGSVWTFDGLSINKTTETSWQLFLFISGSVSEGNSGFPVSNAAQKTDFVFELTATA